AKPIHIGENGFTNEANGSWLFSATLRGNPRCTNIARVDVIFIPASKCGDVAARPARRLLPDRNATTSATDVGSSPRTVNRRSLLSSTSGTLNSARRKVISCAPRATSVGPATARFRTGSSPERVRGIADLTRDAGKRLK